MNQTVDTDVLDDQGITLGEFLVLALYQMKLDISVIHDNLCAQGYLYQPNFYKEELRITEKGTEKFLKSYLQSFDCIKQSPVGDYVQLATTLCNLYPEGNCMGCTYPLKADFDQIRINLMLLTVAHGFVFTADEAIAAVQEYVVDFITDRSYMLKLKHFIWKWQHDDGQVYGVSMMESIILNQREKKNQKKQRKEVVYESNN